MVAMYSLYIQFASGINEKELQAMRESVSSWTSGPLKEEDSRHHPIGPSLSPPGPMIGPTIGPIQVIMMMS